jgi:hypothetical protein
VEARLDRDHRHLESLEASADVEGDGIAAL